MAPVSARSKGRTACAAQPARSARARGALEAVRHAFGRGQPGEPEPQHPERVARELDRRQRVAEEAVRIAADVRLHQAAVGAGVGLAQPGRRLLDGTAEQDRGLVVQRVRDRGLRVQPPQPVVGQRQLPEPRRADAHRVGAGADVVGEAGQGELGGARAAADLRVPFQDQDRRARAGQPHRGREPVRPSAHDDRVHLALLCHGPPATLPARPGPGILPGPETARREHA